MKKILVIGGLHGNEPLGVALVQSLIKSPIDGVDCVLGNPDAILQNVRFVEKDLNRVFPGDNRGCIEERRAAELMKIVLGYDIVLDFHNTNAHNNDCGFVSGSNYAVLLPTMSRLGLDRVIVVDYDCINKYVPTCISVETSLSSPNNSVAYWRKKIELLTSPPRGVASRRGPGLYRMCKRVTSEEQKTYRFDWRVFEPISLADQARLSLPPSTYYPIFVADEYTPQNYAALVEKITPTPGTDNRRCS